MLDSIRYTYDRPNRHENANAQLKKAARRGCAAMLALLATGATAGFVARLGTGLSGLDTDVQNEPNIPELGAIAAFLDQFGLTAGGQNCDFA